MTISDQAGPDDPLTHRRKRLLYQSRYRGTQEADLLIGGFAERHLFSLTAAQLDSYEKLLDESDVDDLRAMVYVGRRGQHSPADFKWLVAALRHRT